MKQRNVTPFELIAACDPPLVIAPGQIVEHDSILTGCEVVEEEAGAAEEVPAETKKTSKAPTEAPEGPTK